MKYCPQMGLMTRTSLPAEKHNGIKSGIKEAGNAMAYNGKSTEKWYSSYVKRTIPQDLGTSMAFGIAGSVIGRKNRVVNRWINRVYIK